MEYIREKGGLRPDDITRDLVKNKQLPRSILNEKGMGTDELASLQDVQDFGLDTEETQGDNALLDALVAEYTTGEKRYSTAQLNGELLSEARTLNDLSRDLAAAGIDLSANTDNAAVREALSKYYEAQNGENTREEPETAEALRYEQRGFTESDEPGEEERAEANRQYDEIEKKYRRTPLWMKAPNGEPTKLTERQWVQVRTPNFKKWFGDWEKAGIRERLENQEPVAVEAKYNVASPKERRDIALEFFPENVVVQKPVGDVVISKRSIRSSFSHGSTDVKLDVMPYLTEVLEKSEYIDTLRDFDGNDIQNHYFATRIMHGGQEKLVFMRARKMPGRENQLYVHDVFVEEDIKQKDRDNVSKSGYSQKTVSQLRGPDLYRSILQDIYSTDNESVSKVVDSNGEPKRSDVEVFLSGQNILYQLIGEKGAAALDRAREATIRLDNLSIAREMEKEGKEAKAVKLATGWERGADGKWRYEIDDSSSVFSAGGDIEFGKRHPEYRRMKELSGKFLFGDLSKEEFEELGKAESLFGSEPERLKERLKEGNARLPDVLDHPELLTAYPELNDIKVLLTDQLREGNLGGYSKEENLIAISDKADNPHSVLLHEVQHAIQRIEGFARGGQGRGSGKIPAHGRRNGSEERAVASVHDTRTAQTVSCIRNRRRGTGRPAIFVSESCERERRESQRIIRLREQHHSFDEGGGLFDVCARIGAFHAGDGCRDGES
jgi:hypothetical protein